MVRLLALRLLSLPLSLSLSLPPSPPLLLSAPYGSISLSVRRTIASLCFALSFNTTRVFAFATAATRESAMEALGMIGVRYLDTEEVKLTHGAWPRVYQ